MSIKISLLTEDGTSKPISGDDYMIMSNTDDGGTTYNVSKKILISELLAYLGVSIADDFLVIGNGTGIEASTGKAGAVSGYPDDFAIAHEDFFNDSEFLAYQDR